MFGSSIVDRVKLRDPIEFRRRRYAFVGILRPTRKRLLKAEKLCRKMISKGDTSVFNQSFALLGIMTDLPKAACQLLSHDDAKALMVEIDKLIGGASI